jgi:hypothetical protein
MHLISRTEGILSLKCSLDYPGPTSDRQSREYATGSVINTIYLSSSAGYSIKFKTDGCLNFIMFIGSFFNA